MDVMELNDLMVNFWNFWVFDTWLLQLPSHLHQAGGSQSPLNICYFATDRFLVLSSQYRNPLFRNKFILAGMLIIIFTNFCSIEALLFEIKVLLYRSIWGTVIFWSNTFRTNLLVMTIRSSFCSGFVICVDSTRGMDICWVQCCFVAHKDSF